MTQQAMKIVDINGVFVEAFLLDASNEIAFISLIGKDTALQEFRARWSLPASQGGLTDFQVETNDSTIRLFLGEIKKMQTLSGRLSTHLFGDLIQLWLFKELSQTPDYANRQAIQLYRPDDDADAIQDNLWTLIKDLSHLPLLDEWRTVIVDLLIEKQWITTWQGVGLFAHHIHLPEEELALLLQANIQSGALLAAANSQGQWVVCDQQTMVLMKMDKSSDESSPATTDDNFWSDAKVVSTYRREQAIDDGFLVDVSQLAKEAGFIVPVAMTIEAWRKCVYWPTDYGSHQDETGRLWDVLYLAFLAMKRAPTGGSQLLYKLLCVPADGSSLDALEVELKIISGPGDEGEHVITLMLPNES